MLTINSIQLAVFPADHLSIDPRSGVKRRHHLGPDYLRDEVRKAIRKAGINKNAACHPVGYIV